MLKFNSQRESSCLKAKVLRKFSVFNQEFYKNLIEIIFLINSLGRKWFDFFNLKNSYIKKIEISYIFIIVYLIFLK